MNGNRPDVSDEDIGMRAFQLRKEKAVERSIERLRQGLKTSWSFFETKELDDFRWIIGELWAFEKRADWEDLHFSKLNVDDVRAIVGYAQQLRADAHNTVETLERVGDIVRARSI
jgi:hypothetical protein